MLKVSLPYCVFCDSLDNTRICRLSESWHGPVCQKCRDAGKHKTLRKFDAESFFLRSNGE